MYGLQITNANGQVLVDSDFEHFHFAGRAVLFETTRVPDILSGNNTQHSDPGGQYMSSSQKNGDIFKFILYANADGTSPAPICFIKPSATGTSAPKCAVILTQRSGANWIFWVLQTQGSSAPSVYCFLPLRVMLPSYADPPAGDAYSLVTYSSSGRRTYDARIRPLKLIAAGTTAPPTIARSGGKSNGWNPVFTPDITYIADFSPSVSVDASDLMFYCPSLAHACQEHTETHSGDGYQSQGYSSFFYAWSRADLWWCFYRSTFRIRSATQFEAGYDIYASGHVWQSEEDTSSVFIAFVAVALAAFTFGASLSLIAVAVVSVAIVSSFASANVSLGTYYPYQNGSRNADQTTGFLISRSSYYD